MNAVELLTETGKPSAIFMCMKCRTIHSRQYAALSVGGRNLTDEERDAYARNKAEKCCNYKCEDCGKDAKQHHDLCDECRSKRWEKEAIAKEEAAFAKAKKLTIDEFAASDYSDNYLFDAACDRWHSNLDDAFEWYEDDEEREQPAYLWCSEPTKMTIDVSGYVMDQVSDNSYEDACDSFSKEVLKELDDFADAWWERNQPTSYEPCNVCVLIEKQAANKQPQPLEVPC